MPNVTRKLTAENSQFSMVAAAQFSLSQDSGSKARRKFSGVAYSGESIKKHWYWGDVVFDLHSMTVPAKLPALIDHDRGARCGYVVDHAINEASGLTVNGNLLSNEHGTAVATESDEGFPWQMSVHIEPGSVEEVMSSSNVTVNGRDFAGPITVFRNSKIAEVSFTATGWDSNTSATAMSRGNSINSNEETAMDLTQAQARIAELDAANAALQASNAKLTTDVESTKQALAKFSSDARKTAVTQLFADVGRKPVEGDDPAMVQFCAMSDETFTATAGVMREQFKQAPVANPGIPASLFSHVAATVTGEGGQASKADVNPLMADAQKRAQTFSKRTS